MQSLKDEMFFARSLIGQCNETTYEVFHAPVPQEVRNKPDKSVVMEHDEKTSKVVVAAYKNRPDGVSKVLSEEEGSTASYGDREMVVVDPIDGSRNFAEGQLLKVRHSLAGTSIGLWRNGPVMGVAGFPLLGIDPVVYSAYEGGGAFREYEGRRVPLRIDKKPTKGVVLVTVKQGRRARALIANLKLMGYEALPVDGAVFKGCTVADPQLLKLYRFRGFGVPKKPIVGFVSYGVHLHDVAAVTCIVREAGGVATQPKNAKGEQIWAAANNADVHVDLMQAAQP